MSRLGLRGSFPAGGAEKSACESERNQSPPPKLRLCTHQAARRRAACGQHQAAGVRIERDNWQARRSLRHWLACASFVELRKCSAGPQRLRWVAARRVCTFKLSDAEEVARRVDERLWNRVQVALSVPTTGRRPGLHVHARLRPSRGFFMNEHICDPMPFSAMGCCRAMVGTNYNFAIVYYSFRAIISSNFMLFKYIYAITQALLV